jgi:hypothetical protein
MTSRSESEKKVIVFGVKAMRFVCSAFDSIGTEVVQTEATVTLNRNPPPMPILDHPIYAWWARSPRNPRTPIITGTRTRDLRRER